MVVPLYNEAGSIVEKGGELVRYLVALNRPFELLLVNDGSTDGTVAELHRLREQFPTHRIEIISYSPNRGIGYALRKGFSAARNDCVVSIDADLSYSVDHIGRLLAVLETEPSVDLVVGSAYMPGGSSQHVPPFRSWVSRMGNCFLKFAVEDRLSTVTCVLRAYRRSALLALPLFSDKKEIHLEVIAKAFALGLEVKEIPAHLSWDPNKPRRRGGFRIFATSASHLLFSFSERPMLLFGLVGLTFVSLGVGLGVYLTALYMEEALNPTRPLFTLLVLLITTGSQILLFGFLGMELRNVRRDLVRLHSYSKETQESDVPHVRAS